MIDFTRGRRRFNFRTAAVLAQDGHVLLHTMEDSDYWILPGGRVELGETSIGALQREMREELGQEIQVGRLLWVAESLLRDGRHLTHGLGFYYAISLVDPSSFIAPGETYRTRDSGVRLTFAWHPLDRLDQITIYPPFLRQGLPALPEQTQHILDVRS
jgi:ADP-ribose pyrophosphatase YjhB (NUDIX family)